MADTPEDPSFSVKRKPGRPKGATLAAPVRNAAFTMSMAEAVREGVDPRHIRQFHILVASGVNPVFKLDKHNTVIDVIPDPSPLAQTPDLARKSESLKFLTAYGWGQPAQSTQIEIDFQARINALGSGISNELLMSINPEALSMLGKAIQLALPQGNPHSVVDVTDAELVNLDAPTEITGAPDVNSPPETTNSGT